MTNSYLLRRYASVLLVLIIINDYPIFVEIAIFCHKKRHRPLGRCRFSYRGASPAAGNEKQKTSSAARLRQKRFPAVIRRLLAARFSVFSRPSRNGRPSRPSRNGRPGHSGRPSRPGRSGRHQNRTSRRHKRESCQIRRPCARRGSRR